MQKGQTMAKNELLNKVYSINKLFNHKPYKEGAYKLDIAYGGYQLTKIVNDGGGETDISPRLKASEMREYLNGFTKGVLAMYEERVGIRDGKFTHLI